MEEWQYNTTNCVILILDAIVVQRRNPAALPPWDVPCAHSVGDRVGSRAALGTVERSGLLFVLRNEPYFEAFV